MFLIIVTYTKPIEAIDRVLLPHREYLQTYINSGDLIFAGRKEPRSGGIILLKSDDRKFVDHFIAGDPFSIADVASYEVTEFKVTLTHPDFRF